MKFNPLKGIHVNVKKHLHTEVRLAGVNAAIGAFSIAGLNVIAGLPSPDKLLVLYFGMLLVGVGVSMFIHQIMKKGRSKLESIETHIGMSCMGIVLVLVTSEFSYWIVPHYGYSISPFSMGSTAVAGVSVFMPIALVSMLIIAYGIIRKN